MHCNMNPTVCRYVHHLSQDMKELLGGAGVPLPLLSPTAHHGASVCQAPLAPHSQRICDAYMEQVSRNVRIVKFKAIS